MRLSPGTKIVRIASPPVGLQHEKIVQDANYRAASPDLRYVPGQSALSTPPTGSDLESSGPYSLNPFQADTLEEDEEDDGPEDEELLRNTRSNASVLPTRSQMRPRRSSNPYRTSLNNREEALDGLPMDTVTFAGQPPLVGKAGLGTTRASLDVDTFKRLVMTGEKGAAAPYHPPTLPAQNPGPHSLLGDSSSNTDTSSISRQSIFEPVTETLTDTPRTSHEISVSDDEWPRAVGTSKQKTRAERPRISRGSHGHSGNSVASYNVPFARPSSSTPSADVAQGYDKSSPVARRNTDLNKPLPPPPRPMQPERSRSVQQDFVQPEDLLTKPSSTSTSATPQKKRPPTPPLTRRHSQLLSPNPLVSRSNSARLPPRPRSLVTSAQPTETRTPPPPPARRTIHERTRSSFDSSMHSTTLSTSPPSPANNATVSGKPSTPRPPLPPMRTRSVHGGARPQRATHLPSTTASPPPVPPRRNRGSSQSSLSSSILPSSTAPITSSTGAESHSYDFPSPATSSPKMVASISETSGSDILADLSALQKEVDELRGQYEIKRSSH